MAKTEAELIDEAIDRGLDDAQIKELLVRERTKTAPATAAAPVAPKPTTPRPAPAAAAKPAPLTAVAAPRVTAPPPAEPAMEAMVSSVKPIAAPAQTPAKPSPQPTMSGAELAAEEQIQLERMLAEQDAIREAQNIGWVRDATKPLAGLSTLLAPAVLASGPISAPLVGLAALAPGAATAVPEVITAGMSKLGLYGKTEATPAMRQEARRRAQASAGTQQYAASEQNLGSMLSVGTLGIPAEVARPFSELGKIPGAVGKAVAEVVSPRPDSAYGKLLAANKGQPTPKMGPQTPEEFALRKGGAFAENARRVKAAPEKFLPVGPRDTETGRITGNEYGLIVSPKVAYREHNAQFEEWAKRFPKEAATIRTEAAKEFAAERPARKAAVLTDKVAAFVEKGELPIADDVGMSEQELSQVLSLMALTPAENLSGKLSPQRAASLAAKLRSTSTTSP